MEQAQVAAVTTRTALDQAQQEKARTEESLSAARLEVLTLKQEADVARIGHQGALSAVERTESQLALVHERGRNAEQSADTLGMEEGVPVGEGTGTPVVVGIGEGDDLFGTFFEILSFRLVVVAPSASLRSAISPLLNVVACSRAMELCVGELPRIAVGDPPGMNAVKAVKTENDKNR